MIFLALWIAVWPIWLPNEDLSYYLNYELDDDRVIDEWGYDSPYWAIYEFA